MSPTDQPEATRPEPDDAREEQLIACVRAALDAREAGEPLDLDAICHEHPDLRPAVAEALGLTGDLPALQRGAQDFDPLRGRLLGDRYELVERIGTGAMGAVYRGIDRELERDVAVKVYERIGGTDPSGEARFLREAELLAQLKHPNVVAVHDRGRSDDGLLFLVMDLLVGAPLSAVLAELCERPDAPLSELANAWGPRSDDPPPESTPLRQIVHWIADVARGLQEAHENDVFHRDVKPSNVFVLADHRAVLLDFGIAARPDEQASTLTASGIGTPWYMAPEQAAGLERASAAIDVYGLCATLYHLLTLRPPVEGDTAQALLKLQRDDPIPASQLRPDLPRDLVAIIDHGLEHDPRRRYQNVAALEVDLRAFLDHRPVSARPLTRAGRAWRRMQRRPAKSIAIAASALVVFLLAIGVPIWNAQRAHAASVQRADLFAELPALLAIEGQPSQRLLVSFAEHRHSIAALDQLIDLDPNDLPSRLWRAALHLDHGRFDVAGGDLEAIADAHATSPYLAEVARRYLAANRDERGVAAVDLTDLPAPESAHDHFVAGFHELRNRHVRGFAQRAEEHLRKAKDTYLPARDLRLLALVERGVAERDNKWYQAAHDDSLFLEGRYDAATPEPNDGATARTLALRGAALLGLRRYADAVAPLERSNAMRSGRHGPLLNLGIAHRRLGELDLAMEYLRAATAVRPHFWNTIYTTAQVQMDRREFDAAMKTAASIPDDGTERVRWRRVELGATIRMHEAIARYGDGDLDAASEIAKDSVTRFDAAMEIAPPRIDKALARRRVIPVALSDGDFGLATLHLLNLLQSRPVDPYRIGNLATMLPETGLNAETTWFLRLFLRKLARELSGGDEMHVRLQDSQYSKDLENRPGDTEHR